MLSDVTKKTKLVRKSLLVFAVLIIAGVGILSVAPLLNNKNATYSQNSSPQVVVNNKVLSVEIANTSQKQKLGLCCRDTLAENAGMLFVYDTAEVRRFWMKDTRIPLDMYWLNKDREIVYVAQNVQPSSYPKSFGPDIPTWYVLETNAGYASSHGVTVGQTVEFKL